MHWFEVVAKRGTSAEGKVEEFQVTLKVRFKIDR
jgi:flavin-binding protein dodecin